MDKAERLAAEALKDRGYMYPEWKYVAANDPDFMESYNAYYRDALARDEGLPIKYRELVALGILAYRGVWEGALINHIKRALQPGKASVAYDPTLVSVDKLRDAVEGAGYDVPR